MPSIMPFAESKRLQAKRLALVQCRRNLRGAFGEARPPRSRRSARDKFVDSRPDGAGGIEAAEKTNARFLPPRLADFR